MEIRLDPKDDRLQRYENMLAGLEEGQANKVFARALNHEGDKKRTQVVRELVKATGLKYRDIREALVTVRARAGSLEYKLVFKGSELNLSKFGVSKDVLTRKVIPRVGVSAAPWGVRRTFPGTFVIKKFGGKVFKRTGAASRPTQHKLMDYGHRGVGRLPIRQVYGPNLAREVMKGKPLAAWDDNMDSVINRVGHEIEQVMIAEMTGVPMGSWAD